MTEKQLQFRVGLFVITSFLVGAGILMQFTEMGTVWKQSYQIAVHFDEVPGLQVGCPVKQNGITIGDVDEILLDEEIGGVLVVLNIQEDRKLKSDVSAQLSRSVFGDATINFSPGTSSEILPPMARLKGAAISDPMLVVERLENTVSAAIGSFVETSQEWQKVARNINGFIDHNENDLHAAVSQSVKTLEKFNKTMEIAAMTFTESTHTLRAASVTLQSANSLMADPKLQQDLRQTAASLPLIAEETRQTIAAARISMAKVSENLATIQQATLPLAMESDVIAKRLSGSLVQLEILLTELSQFSQVLNSKDGSLQKLASDPQLYHNLNRSASSLSVLFDNLNPTLNDFRIFADKVARHPELLGVSGAMRGSTGVKDAGEVQQTGYSTSQPRQ